MLTYHDPVERSSSEISLRKYSRDLRPVTWWSTAWDPVLWLVDGCVTWPALHQSERSTAWDFDNLGTETDNTDSLHRTENIVQWLTIMNNNIVVKYECWIPSEDYQLEVPSCIDHTWVWRSFGHESPVPMWLYAHWIVCWFPLMSSRKKISLILHTYCSLCVPFIITFS